jgi:hypothetical protein
MLAMFAIFAGTNEVRRPLITDSYVLRVHIHAKDRTQLVFSKLLIRSPVNSNSYEDMSCCSRIVVLVSMTVTLGIITTIR